MDMFLGQCKQALSEKHEFEIPEEFRKFLADGLYLTRGFEQNLLLMSEAVFKEKSRRLAALNIADPLVRLLQRLLLSNAIKLDISKSGKVQIPEDLVSASGLQQDIVLVGQGDYAEIWSPRNWEEQNASLMDTKANETRFAQLDLALN
jgi:MraZ protein